MDEDILFMLTLSFSIRNALGVSGGFKEKTVSLGKRITEITETNVRH